MLSPNSSQKRLAQADSSLVSCWALLSAVLACVWFVRCNNIVAQISRGNKQVAIFYSRGKCLLLVGVGHEVTKSKARGSEETMENFNLTINRGRGSSAWSHLSINI
eukprot:GFUD01137132.1.p1 GENE.GFUD01137132.1~~GFUD01137132.1.p1  ORF type:complete len:106 (-),score=3.62 GFUD01137132.1:54-371(-)